MITTDQPRGDWDEFQHCPWWKRPSPWCADPKVQAGAASFMAAMMALGGMISCFTAPVWGSLSDRRGRVFVQRLYAFGPFLSNFVYILVLLSHSRYPIGRHGIVLATAIEGFFAVGTVTVSRAYIADVTEPDVRSKWYTFLQGADYIGSAVGPFISSTIAHFTGNILGVYSFALSTHFFFLAATWLVIPESLQPAQLKASQAIRQRQLVEHQIPKTGLLSRAKAASWSVVEPLSIFLPSKHSFGITSKELERRNWDLMLLGLAYFPDTLIVYGIGIYDWTTEEVGVVLSLNAMAKVIFCLVFLPWIISTCRPTSAPLPLRSSTLSDTENTSLLAPTYSELTTAHDRGVKWDLGLARVSVVLAAGAIVVLGLAQTSTVFIFGILFVCLGSGFVPTVQSISLEFYRRRGGTESGSLFGALAVINVFGLVPSITYSAPQY
ncbi:major facilitator superfamily domain-containing protein [Vararia minispora EC-137]|uniref:Major facilitator superfamily domain-containing protein n=1 Tax=Vararia minispora EC-137 TaxID=1314806 RepID=A0ACB8QZG4_9AGAM|nr:major facilitator superfamily domain-containing protein [Vararia minispora EC-137]